MQNPMISDAGLRYVAYDRQTGVILYSYAKLDVQANHYVETSAEELKKEISSDPSIVARLTGKSLDNLDVIRVDQSAYVSGAAGFLSVDPNTRKLVVKPRLLAKAAKTQLDGDGDDTTMIEIQAVDAGGKPLRNLEDDIRITTERGKLSERGGLVKLVHGRATIELKSVAETVRKVRVRAESLSGKASPGEVLLEFV
jgi:hypothetical protein